MTEKFKRILIQLLAVVSIGCFIIGIHKFGEYWLYDYLKMQADSYSSKWVKFLIVGSPMFAIFMYISLLNSYFWQSFSKKRNPNE